MRYLFTVLVAGAIAAHAGTLVTFAPPSNGYFSVDGSYRVTLNLSGSADPTSLRITSGPADVTPQFNVNSCSKAPCTITGLLTFGAGVMAGQNMLTAIVHGGNGAVDRAQQRFTYRLGVSDPTDGSAPGNIVPIRQSGNTVTIMTTPESQVVPTCSSQISIAVYDRSSLRPKTSTCVADAGVDAYLKTRDATDLLIVIADSGTGAADFSAMGGNGDKTPKAGYYAVGYGGGSTGTAYEAWQESGDDGSHPKTIQGNLINIGCSDKILVCKTNTNAPYYAFMSTNAQGFAIVPGVAGSPGNPGMPVVYIGNPSRVPLDNDSDAPNQTKPQNSSTSRSLFTNTTYAPQWTEGTDAGGVYLLTLNRSDLTRFNEQIFVTNCNCTDHTNDNAQINALAATLADKNPNRLFVVTTIGIPFNADSTLAPLKDEMLTLGVSPFALQSIVPDRLGNNTAKAGFSMVTYAPRPGPDPTKFYSTAGNTQQGETGALRGIFSKKQTAYYEAVNVGPFLVASLPENAGADFYLQGALTYALNSTEPVAWPGMATAGQRAAYAYLSNQLIVANLYFGDAKQCAMECYDVRYYYTGTVAPILYSRLAPNAVTYPGDSAAQGFVLADFATVQQQLSLESLYLSEALAYRTYTDQIHSSDGLNVAIVLQNAGTEIANSLEKTLTTQKVGPSAVRLTSDAFNLAGAAISAFGGIEGAGAFVAPIAGIFGVVGNSMAIYLDAQKTTPEAVPYVNQLSDLWADTSGKTSAAALRFNEDMQTASGVFYDAVFSDWFRLQSVALLSVDQGYGGWYVADQGASRSDYLNALTISQRSSLWVQILPQYFELIGAVNVASGWVRYNYNLDATGAVKRFGHYYIDLNDGNDPLWNTNHWTDYSWQNRTRSAVCEDYTLVFVKGQFNTYWSNDFGDELFGNQVSSDGQSGQLNMDRNFVYDAIGMPYRSGYPAQPYNTDGPYSGSTDQQNYNCAGHPESSWDSTILTPVFSNLTRSQTVNEGTTSITLSGRILAGTSVPKGSVDITINDTTKSTNIGADGSFSYTFSTNQIPASPQPYTITYAYAGSSTTPQYYPASDVTTTLTIRSLSTTTALKIVADTGATYPANVELIALLSSAAGTPTGAVTFLDNGQPLGSADLSGGEAKLAPQLNAGAHTFSASYAAQAGFKGSTSDQVYLTIAQAPTKLIGSTLPYVPFGTQSVQISGTIQAGQGYLPASSPVTITVNGNSQGTTTGAKGAFALSFQTQAIPGGKYPVKVDYVGSTNYATLSDSSMQLEIIQIATTFASLSPSQSIPAGTQVLLLTGKLAPQNSTYPSGFMKVAIGPLQSDPAPIHADGSFDVSFPASTLPVSATPYTIAYLYQGDANFKAFGDASTTLTVTGFSTNASVTSSSPAAAYGTPLTFTAAVIATNGTPTGSVVVYDGATALGRAQLSEGKATLTNSSLGVGVHSISVVYAGDTSFTGATSPTLAQTISTAVSAFTGLTASQSVDLGAPSIQLAGVVSAAPQTGAVLQLTPGGAAAGPVFTYDASGLSTDSATYSMWIKTTVKTQQMIFQAAYEHPYIVMEGDQLRVIYEGSGPADGWLSADATPISDGRWHHIAVTFNKGAITLYKDGVATADSFTVTAPGRASAPVNLGGAYSHIPSFDGKLWNAKIWAKPLSAADLQAEMFQTYGFATPDDLRLLSGFDLTAGTATNLVNGAAATIADAAIISDELPVRYVAASNEQVSITVGSTTLPVPVGANGAFTASFPLKDLPGGDYPIEYSYAGSTTLTAVNDKSTTLTIRKAAPVFSGLTPSQTIQTGTTVVLGGTILAGSTPPTGAVSIIVGGVSTTAAIGAKGAFAATLDVSALAPGAYPVTYAYAATGTLDAASDSSTTLTLHGAPTTTTLQSSANPADYGTPVVFTATVASAGGTPTGSVRFYDGATPLGSGVLTGGQATLKTSLLAVGTHSLTAAYDGGNPDMGRSTSKALVQTINKATPIFSVLPDSQDIAAGTASVTLAGKILAGSVLPTGTITVTINGVGTPATIGVDGSFSAVVDTHSLAPAGYTITYAYAATDNFNGITDSTTKLTVKTGAIATTTTVKSSANPADFGTQVNFTVTVTSQNGAPTGNVTLYDGGVQLGAKTLVSGQATFSSSSLSAGPHSITATFSGGNSGFADSTSAALNQTINTVTPVFSGLASQTINAGTASVKLGGTILAGALAPAGTVSITVNGVSTPTVIGSNGAFSATVDTHLLAPGSYSITYAYVGAGNFGPAHDASTTLTVQSLATTTALSSSGNPAVYGANVIFTATVTSTSGTPSGSIKLQEGTTQLGTATLDATGKATFTINSLTPGQHSITADYLGASGFAASTSSPWTQIVKANAAFSGLTSPSATAGSTSVAFTGVISGTGPTYPDGSSAVTVTIGKLQGSAKPDGLGKFSVTLDVSSLAVGSSYAVTYAYVGDSKLNPAMDASTSLTIKPAGPVASKIQLSVTPNPMQAGQTIAIKALVPPVGGVFPTGNVTISEPITQDGKPVTCPNGVECPPIYGRGDLGANGMVTFTVDTSTISTLTPGVHVLAATYAGDANYLASSSDYYYLTIQPALGEFGGTAAVKISVASVTRSGDMLTLSLKIDNTGSGAAYDTTLTQIVADTRTRTGLATVVTQLPINIGSIAPQGSVTRSITLNVPVTVDRLSLTETGTVHDASIGSSSFSLSQTVVLNPSRKNPKL
ncbi:MAG: Ig-like domain repeat protein [Acidobacteriaceae bacterium]|nr:Ig-like domain repeat protein [Acidobacteriaceae bacterium]